MYKIRFYVLSKQSLAHLCIFFISNNRSFAYFHVQKSSTNTNTNHTKFYLGIFIILPFSLLIAVHYWIPWTFFVAEASKAKVDSNNSGEESTVISALIVIYCVIFGKLFICLIYHSCKEMILLMKVVVVMCACCQCSLYFYVLTLCVKHFECVLSVSPNSSLLRPYHCPWVRRGKSFLACCSTFPEDTQIEEEWWAHIYSYILASS